MKHLSAQHRLSKKSGVSENDYRAQLYNVLSQFLIHIRSDKFMFWSCQIAFWEILFSCVGHQKDNLLCTKIAGTVKNEPWCYKNRTLGSEKNWFHAELLKSLVFHRFEKDGLKTSHFFPELLKSWIFQRFEKFVFKNPTILCQPCQITDALFLYPLTELLSCRKIWG